jgi:cyanophycinase
VGVSGVGICTLRRGRVPHSNAPDVANDETLAITDVKVHVLPRDYGFNLATKRPIVLAQGEIDESGSAE